MCIFPTFHDIFHIKEWGSLLKMTENARILLEAAIEKEKQTPDEPLFVRLSMGVGWGGPKLNLSLEERKISGDLIFEFDSVKIIIHEREYVYFENTKLDYVRDALGNGAFKLLKI